MYTVCFYTSSKKYKTIIDTIKELLDKGGVNSYTIIFILSIFYILVAVLTYGLSIPITFIVLKVINILHNTLSSNFELLYYKGSFEYKFFKNNYYRFYNEDFGLIGTKGSGFLKTKKLRKFYVSYEIKRKFEKIVEQIKEDGKTRETTEEWKVLFDQLGVVNELVDKLNVEYYDEHFGVNKVGMERFIEYKNNKYVIYKEGDI